MSHRRSVFRRVHVWLLIGAVLTAGWGLTGCDDKPAKPPSSPATQSTPPTPAATSASGNLTSSETSVPTTHLPVVALDDINALIAETAERKQILVIDFWATWCVPCVEMFPGLHEGLVARGDKVRAVTVTLDDPSREAKAVAFLAKHDALHDAYIIKNDSEAQQAVADGVGKKWDSLVVPAVLVYDASGQLSDEFLEGGATQAILHHIDQLIASGKEHMP